MMDSTLRLRLSILLTVLLLALAGCSDDNGSTDTGNHQSSDAGEDTTADDATPTPDGGADTSDAAEDTGDAETPEDAADTADVVDAADTGDDADVYTIDPNRRAPHGIFPMMYDDEVLVDTNDGSVELTDEFTTIISKDYVAGITLYMAWPRLEPQKDAYEWAALEAVLDGVAQHDKSLNLAILGAQHSPEWLYDEDRIAEHTYTNADGDQLRAPVPWNQTYLNRYFALIRELGSRMQTDPQQYEPIGRLMVAGPTNHDGFEMMLVGDADDRQFYADNGYPDKFVGAWEDAIDLFSHTIPNWVELNVVWSRGMAGEPTHDHSKEIADHVAEKALVPRTNLMLLGLRGQDWWNFSETAPSDDADLQKEMLEKVELEMTGRAFRLGLQPSAPDTAGSQTYGDFEVAMDNAAQMGATWVEPYAADILAAEEGSATQADREAKLEWLAGQL